MAQNSLSNFSRELPKEPSCEIISKSATDLAEVIKRSFLFIAQVAILFNGVEPFGNFGRGLAKERFCEIIPKSVHLFSRGSCLKLFSIYSPGGHLVQQSGTV